MTNERVPGGGDAPLIATITSARVEESIFGPAVDSPSIQIGKYQILRLLGSGATGVVYAASDPSLGREVAIKVLRGAAIVSANDRTRLMREAQVLAKLSHPNIVTVFEIIETQGSSSLVMELVNGPSLHDWMRIQPRDWRAVLEKFEGAAKGLAAAHAAGVVHGDFKPGNAVVGADGRVRVVDFGFARLDPGRATSSTPLVGAPQAASGGSTDLLGGTPGYMAPERAAGSSATHASDQFSLCKALSQALAEASPAASRDRARVPRQILQAIDRGMRARPEERWPTMNALLVGLEQRKPSSARAVAVAGTVAVGVLSAQWWVANGRDEESRRDIGRIELAIRFDSGASASMAGVGIYGRRPDGGPDGSALKHATIETRLVDPSTVVASIDAPAGPAYLRLERQGCGPVWLPIERFPGYANRAEPPTHRLEVPACGGAGLTPVPAGEFIFSGAGEPVPRHTEYIGPEVALRLDAFEISTREVSRGEYRRFAALSLLTGRSMPQPIPDPHGVANDEIPITNISWFAAMEYCRFIGGSLPTTQQWEKAFRGGVQLGGAPNPAPRRNLPWGTADAEGTANLATAGDGHDGAAPTVGAFDGDRSPYGVLALAGNVREWTRSVPGASDEGLPSDGPWASMRVVRGSAFDTSIDAEEHFAAYENMRDANFIGFDLGFRCVVESGHSFP